MKRTAPIPAGSRVPVDLEGETVEARAGEPLACALIAAGVSTFSRSPKYHRPRGAFCLSGSCGHCLMQVDGVPNVPTCRVPARAGMKLQRQNAFPSGDLDVFEAVDWLFPRGMDHHEMFAGVPVAEQVMLHVARALAGLGTLPSGAAPKRAAAETVHVDAVVLGGGPAGLAAAAELVRSGFTVRLLEREPFLGGRCTAGAPEAGSPPLPALPPGVAHTREAAIGLFSEGGERFVASVSHSASGPVLRRVYGRAFVVATGGYPAILPFENNDLPGIYAGRAASTLLRIHDVLPGERVIVVGEGPELHPLARALRDAGAEVPRVLQLSGALPADALPVARVGTPVRASGLGHVKALTWTDGQHDQRDGCDALVISLPPSPALELARQGGARVVFMDSLNVFAVEADAEGRTGVAGLFAAGDVTSPGTAAAALESGKRAGRRAAAWLGSARAGEVSP